MRRLLIIVVLSFSLIGCSNVFFFPYHEHVQTPERLGLKYEDVYFNASDGTRLHGWFLPGAGRALGTILFLHGNAENVSTHIMSVRWLPARPSMAAVAAVSTALRSFSGSIRWL